MTYAYGRDEHGESGSIVHRSGTSIAFRYGYEVDGSQARYIGTVYEGGYREIARRRTEAETAAQKSATEVMRVLREVGAPHVVRWWVQEVTSTTEVVYAEPVLTVVTK